MKLFISKPKPIAHVNPDLVGGRVYQMLKCDLVYLAVRTLGPITDGIPKLKVYLINVVSGERFSDDGFGNSEFADVTNNCYLRVG